MTHAFSFSSVSVIIPAKNEELGLKRFLSTLINVFPSFEIIVVDDGSYDNTANVCRALGVTLCTHPYPMGNGAAIKTGVRKANGDILILMDADGQHQVESLMPLLTKYLEGFDMVVGERKPDAQANVIRYIGNSFYNYLASKIVGHPVKDLTSGCRVVHAEKFKKFMHLLPNGFSSPTTLTMAFFRSGFTVAYVPINVLPRIGKSHLHPLTDGIRFLLIIYKMTILYSPIKVFFPLALLHFFAGGINYAYTFFTQGRFTNMSAVFFSTAIIIFLIGLVSEQITALIYAPRQNADSLKQPLFSYRIKKIRKAHAKVSKIMRKDH